ncbi:MAG: hypothetical protein ABIH50_06090 [bacterium]
MKNKLIIIALLSFCLAGSLFAADEVKRLYTSGGEDARIIGQALNTALLGQSSRVWPGTPWAKLQVAIVGRQDSFTYLWNTEGNRLLVKTWKNQLPAELSDCSYWHISRWKGRDILVVCVNDYNNDIDEILELICHEGFHLVGQAGWAKDKENGWRGDVYPEKIEPRLLRRELMNSLYEHIRGNSSASLGEAVYWHNKYCLEFPAEKKEQEYTDRIEGSADYVGLLGAALGRLGIAASNEAILADVRKRLARRWKNKYNNFLYQGSLKEGESYAIGAMAGLALERIKVPGWQEKVAQGKTPMDILAENAPPLPTFQDPTIIEKVDNYYQNKNRELGSLLGRFFQETGTTEYSSLLLPLDWAVGGTWNRKSFFAYYDNGTPRRFIVSLAGKFRSPASSDLEIKGSLAEMIMGRYPLNNDLYGYVVVPFPASSLVISAEGSASLDTKNISARKLFYKKREDPRGRTEILIK